MKTILFGVVILILLVGVILIYNDYNVKRRLRKLAQQKYKIVEPFIDKLKAHEAPEENEVHELAKDPSFRHSLFRILDAYGRKDLFPLKYYTHEKAAESFLVSWLEFPTELGGAPEQIELLKVVTLMDEESLVDEESLDYYVFKFRTTVPLWAARLNWMLGVSGPYRKATMPYDVPVKVFSRFNAVDSISPETEALWVHENIGLRR